MNSQEFISITKEWIQKVVIGLDFCPFARFPFDEDTIHYRVSLAEDSALSNIEQELDALVANANNETTIVIMPSLIDFNKYLDVVELCEGLIEQKQLDGIFQIASFHPKYQFHDLEKEDIRNATNQSPYPMIHILRESSVTKAVNSHHNIHLIPQKNQEKLLRLGWHELDALIKS